MCVVCVHDTLALYSFDSCGSTRSPCVVMEHFGFPIEPCEYYLLNSTYPMPTATAVDFLGEVNVFTPSSRFRLTLYRRPSGSALRPVEEFTVLELNGPNGAFLR